MAKRNRIEGMSSLFSFLNDVHCAGEGVMAFLCRGMFCATNFRVVCKVFKEAIACFPWRHCDAFIKRLPHWRACFPRALCAQIWAVKPLANALQDVREVELMNCSTAFVRSFLLSSNITVLELSGVFVVDQLQALVAAERCSSLRKLAVSVCTDELLANIAARCPHLQEFEFDDNTWSPNLQVFEFDDNTWRKAVELKISAKGLAHLGRLRSLSLHSDFTTDAVLTTIARNFPELTSFSVSLAGVFVSETSLLSVVANCPLESLTVIGNFNENVAEQAIPTDDLLFALVQFKPGIKSVQLFNAMVTDAGVLAMLKGCSLSYLKIVECELVEEGGQAAAQARFPECFDM
jgi:hypothetical protein